ncbi:MAG: PAS domain S-box protein [Candidatus Sumerlaeia bacterium]
MADKYNDDINLPDGSGFSDAERLRKKVEDMLAGNHSDVEDLSQEEVKRVIEELQLHQVELQMQNEQLRQTQSELEESRSDYADLYDYAPVGYLTIDGAGIIKRVNFTLADMLGCTKKDLVGNPLGRFVPEEARNAFYSYYRRFLVTSSLKKWETLLQSRDGSRLDVMLEKRREKSQGPFGNESGSLRQVAVIDISDRKEAERALKDLNNELDKRVQDRTFELREEITERKKIEEQLRKIQERLDMALWGARVAWWSWDVPSGEVVTSTGKCEMLGYDPKDFGLREDGVIAQHVDQWISLIHPEDYEGAMECMRGHLRGEKDLYEVRYRLQKADGDWMWLFDRGRIVARDEDGKPLRLNGVVQDISETRKSELEREWFFNLSIDMLTIAGLDGCFRQLNPAWEKILGWEHGELQGHSLLEFIHPEDRDEAQTVIDVLKAGRSVASYENRFRCKDGSYKWLLWSSFSLPGEGLAFSVTRDITDRKRTEQELNQLNQELEQRVEERTRALQSETEKHKQTAMDLTLFRRALDNAVDSIFVIDRQSMKLVDVNVAACESLGYSREELLQMGPQDLKPLKAREDLEKEFDGVIGGGPEYGAIETLHQRKDGSRFPVEIFLNAAQVHGRNIIVAAARDITERERVQAELEAAKNTAEAANRAKSDFLANMSHEIRTPMNGVIGLTTLLLQTELDARQREYAQATQASATSLLALIDDILDFSKIEAGKMDLETIDFDLHDVLDDIVGILGYKACESRLELICHVDPALPHWLRGDRQKLRQILLNLANNAIKFTESGEVEIQAKLQEAREDDFLVHFSVRDTGIGISPEKSRKLFQAFSQADSSTTRRFGGTGLGLVISKRLAEMMGGSIGLESEEGDGSVFWFELPLEMGEAVGDVDKTIKPELSEDLRVLLVDSCDAFRRNMKKQLLAWGIPDIEEAASLAALSGQLDRAARNHRPVQLIFMDANLDPDEVALTEMLHNISSHTDWGRPEVILMSAINRDEPNVSRELYRCTIAKPLRYDALLKSLLAYGRDFADSTSTARRPTDSVLPASEGLHLSEEMRNFDGVEVLVAEDNPINQMVAEGMLMDLGMSVDCVSNGREAVEAVQQKPYDLVLMDCQMPEMDGFEATGRIRSLDGRYVPIIAMTAAAMKGDREKCLDAGMDDYLAKPVQIEEIRKMVSKYLKMKR